MSRRTLTDQVKELPYEQKIVFWGAVAMALSVVMPWYSDIDAFKSGDTYFGITGPLYLIGILFLGFSSMVIASLLNYTVRDKVERIFSKLASFYVMVGGFCAFLLLMANSVYFHPKFGVNIAIKESRFGMFVAFAGVIAVFYGGYMLRKRRERYADLESRLEPLIDMQSMPERREERDVGRGAERDVERNAERRHADIGARLTREPEREVDMNALRNKTIEEATAEDRVSEGRQNTLL